MVHYSYYKQNPNGRDYKMLPRNLKIDHCRPTTERGRDSEVCDQKERAENGQEPALGSRR